MATSSNVFKMYKVAGHYRSLLLPRKLMLIQNAGLKQTLEEKLGLPAKPKKPLTPYFRFLVQIRPTLVQKNPDAKITDISKMAAEHWEKADPATRQRLENEYKHAIEQYMKARVAYNQILTDDQKELIVQAKEEQMESKERRRIKKKMKEMGKPKKPLMPFLMYMNENQSTRGDMPFREFQIKIAKEWENLPENVKYNYKEESKKSMDVYKRELQIWEEKMVRLGYIDIVRNQALIEPKSRGQSRIRKKSGGEEE